MCTCLRRVLRLFIVLHTFDRLWDYLFVLLFCLFGFCCLISVCLGLWVLRWFCVIVYYVGFCLMGITCWGIDGDCFGWGLFSCFAVVFVLRLDCLLFVLDVWFWCFAAGRVFMIWFDLSVLPFFVNCWFVA